ncbi:unnamed protein product [Notodromas monacha]|uniref:Uncharacterized protein n=1 Tax=Notodromas monacha TaxID=399045 RepID=A0A7R9BE45_9CRUS|nr:unnamed protein product [Notodromas monacha]CAG0912467.1 unnamed protein product [Notodromas monacha]
MGTRSKNEMLYSELDVSMASRVPADGTYVTYCGRNDGTSLMYATMDPQRMGLSHQAATGNSATAMTLPHGVHLPMQQHPTLIQVPMAGMDARTLTRLQPAPDMLMDPSQIPLIGRPNRESSV